MSTATLQGNRCTAVRVTIPAWGAWWADVTIDVAETLSGRVTLKVADLTLVGTIVSGGPSKGQASYRMAAGAAAWGTEISSKGYANDAGVKMSTVLVDAAQAAGETLDATTIPTSRVGPSYTRERGPAARALQLLAPEAWYVGEDGITRLGKRPSVPLTAKASRGIVDLARGTVTLAADEIVTILPGLQVDGLDVVDVVHELDKSALRSTVWGKGRAQTDRHLESMRRVFEQLFPENRYRGLFEYRVVTQEGERMNLQPVRVSTGMPDLRRVPVRPGVPGVRAEVALGSRVLVGFVDSDPSRPVVLAWEDAEGGGFVPTRLDLGDAGGRVIRDGELVTLLGPASLLTGVAMGVLTLHASMVTEGDPGTGYSRVKA